MTTIYDGEKVLSFNEWKVKPEVAKLLSAVEDCEECSGSGEHECDCGDTHICRECEGSGKQQNPRDIYAKLLRTEIQRLRAWRGDIPFKFPSSEQGQRRNQSVPVLLHIH